MHLIRRLRLWLKDRRDPFGRYAHDTWGKKHGHSLKNGHYCAEWDDMYICEDCDEARCCLCFGYQLNKTPQPGCWGIAYEDF